MWINKNYSGSRVAAQTAILFYIIISNDPVMICPEEIDITVEFAVTFFFVDTVNVAVIIGNNRARTAALNNLFYIIPKTSAHCLNFNADIVFKIYRVIQMKAIHRNGIVYSRYAALRIVYKFA